MFLIFFFFFNGKFWKNKHKSMDIYVEKNKNNSRTDVSSGRKSLIVLIMYGTRAMGFIFPRVLDIGKSLFSQISIGSWVINLRRKIRKIAIGNEPLKYEFFDFNQRHVSIFLDDIGHLPVDSSNVCTVLGRNVLDWKFGRSDTFENIWNHNRPRHLRSN